MWHGGCRDVVIDVAGAGRRGGMWRVVDVGVVDVARSRPGVWCG